MKRNAVIRIVIWSIVIAVLLIILFTAIAAPVYRHRNRNDVPAETAIPRPLTEIPEESQPASANAVAADNLNVRQMPNEESNTAGMVTKGEAMEITRVESVNGAQWGYTTYPVQGWVLMEHVELLGEVQETRVTIDVPVQEQEVTGYGMVVDAASVRDMEIEWAAGSIVIRPEDITEIRVQEEGVGQSDNPMVWEVREQKLSIQYSKNKELNLGFGLLTGEMGKDLIIQVPRDWTCRELEITAAAATLDIRELTVSEVEFDGASGTCHFENCTVGKLELDTASGNVHFSGSLQQMECDAASAGVTLVLSNIPGSLEMDTASGDLEVVLPEDAGFTVTMETLSGDFESDFETTSRNGSHIAGNGRCRIDVDAMSGDVMIRKAS